MGWYACGVIDLEFVHEERGRDFRAPWVIGGKMMQIRHESVWLIFTKSQCFIKGWVSGDISKQTNEWLLCPPADFYISFQSAVSTAVLPACMNYTPAKPARLNISRTQPITVTEA